MIVNTGVATSAGWLVPALTFAGVVLGTMATFGVASRNRYVSSITVERNKWIDKLRQNLAAYSDSLYEEMMLGMDFHSDEDGSKSEEQRAIERGSEKAVHLACIRITNVLRLQLNPRGTIDNNILELIEQSPVGSDTPLYLMKEFDWMVMEHGRWLLKAEWERTKFEARGVAWRWLGWRRKARFLAEYELFAAGQGNVGDLLDRFEAYHVERLKLESEQLASAD